MKVRRDRSDVYHDLLETAIKPCRKTRLVYGSNLNFEIIKRYIIELTQAEMLEQEGDFYKTTEKGCKYIDSHKALIKMTESTLPFFGIIPD
jgi:predicted transcriptional regulator